METKIGIARNTGHNLKFLNNCPAVLSFVDRKGGRVEFEFDPSIEVATAPPSVWFDSDSAVDDEFTILLDSGGSFLLQTATYCHSYDSAAQCADDTAALFAGDSTANWDGNEYAARRDQGPCDTLYTRRECERMAKRPRKQKGA